MIPQFTLNRAVAHVIRGLAPRDQTGARADWVLTLPITLRDSIKWEGSVPSRIWGIGVIWAETGDASLQMTDGARFQITLSKQCALTRLEYLDTVCWRNIRGESADPPAYADQAVEYIGGVHVARFAWSATTRKGIGAGAILTTDHNLVHWDVLPGDPDADAIQQALIKGTELFDGPGPAIAAWHAFLEGK